MKRLFLLLWCLCIPWVSKLRYDAVSEELESGFFFPPPPAAPSEGQGGSGGGENPAPPEDADLPVSAFREIWGYVIDGRERSYKSEFPLSDIGYFGAEVNIYGELEGVPKTPRIAGFSGRVHLVVACNGQALSHFALMEGTAVRARLVSSILAASRPFDGLQIDFENVPRRDGESYRSFLRDLRRGLGPEKWFTVALSARMRTIENDVYDYQKIQSIADRILVMAYDEHWSGSAPGPVASMDWCGQVAAYALRVIGPEKLIMGLPFYGRSWGDWNPNQAYIYPTVQRIKEEQRITAVRRVQGMIPTFTYQAPVTATVYYEDDYSLSARMEQYRALGVRAVGFWRVGQESPTIWKRMKLSQTEP
jgi:spore germination protein YaaH